MLSKQKIKTIKRGLARFGLRFCSLIIKILPSISIYGFATFLAKLGYYVAAKQRRIALQSLSIAFGKEKKDSEIKAIAKACFKNMAKGIIELIYLAEHQSLINHKVKIIGKKYLDQAFSQGKGIIAVSAHFGNFPLMLARLSKEGYKVSSIIRFARDEKAENYFNDLRKKVNVGTIYSQPRKQCVDVSIRTLRNNELLFIPLDQNFGTGGVFVDFFGTKAATATGPVIFALRTKAPIIPLFIIREEDNSHKIVVEPPVSLEKGKDFDETVLINISKITNLIEKYIRKYPQEWGWIHRRWKSRPDQ